MPATPSPSLQSERSESGRAEWAARLAGILRGVTVEWHEQWDEAEAMERLRFHGIAIAIFESGTDLSSWPAELVGKINQDARLQALWEADHCKLLKRILAALDEAGTECRVLKGTAMAYLLYDNPAARRRGDSDLLIRPADLAASRTTFREMGLTCEVSDHLGQEVWQYRSEAGFSHAIDLHWRMVASPFLSSVIGEGELFAHPVALPRLGARAATLPKHLLFLRGVINQELHALYGYWSEGENVAEGERLIWLFDVDLLAQSLTGEEWERLTQAALSCGMAWPCLQVLQRAREMLGTRIPSPVEEALSQAPRETDFTRYCRTADMLGRLRMDFAAAKRWSERRALLQRQVFPDQAALTDRFPDKQGWPLPLLWLYRGARAVRRRLRS